MTDENLSSNQKGQDITPLVLPLITLIGDPEENFYQLGVKDKVNYSDISKHLYSQLRILGPSLDPYVHKIIQGALLPKISKGELFSKLLNSYAEGLEKKVEDVALGLLIPEILSGLGGIRSLSFLKKDTRNFGCSSFFRLDQDGRPIHGRILDFPLLGSYNFFERALLCQFKNTPQIFSLSSAGLPYPSLTAMSGNGMTLAIHQKFNNLFDLKGRSIFEIAFELLCQAHSLESALRFLRKQHSITAWGLNMSFASGEVLLVDLCGDDLVYKQVDLHKNKIFYCNNLPIKSHPSTKNPFPPGIIDYCAMRERVAQEKINLAKKKETKNNEDQELLKLMATPLDQRHRKPQDWEMSPLTPSSLTIATLRPIPGAALIVSDPAPRLLQQNISSFEELWADPIIRLINISKKEEKKKEDLDHYHKGLNHLMLSQTHYDQEDLQGAYHNIQLAIHYFELNHYHENYLAKFYFLVYQYLFEKNRKVLFQILEGFKDLQNLIPRRLSQHRLLFIFRLEYHLLGTYSLSDNELDSSEFKNIFKKEKKIPRLIFHFTIKKMIHPRIDINDIVYLH